MVLPVVLSDNIPPAKFQKQQGKRNHGDTRASAARVAVAEVGATPLCLARHDAPTRAEDTPVPTGRQTTYRGTAPLGGRSSSSGGLSRAAGDSRALRRRCQLFKSLRSIRSIRSVTRLTLLTLLTLMTLMTGLTRYHPLTTADRSPPHSAYAGTAGTVAVSFTQQRQRAKGEQAQRARLGNS